MDMCKQKALTPELPYPHIQNKHTRAYINHMCHPQGCSMSKMLLQLLFPEEHLHE